MSRLPSFEHLLSPEPPADRQSERSINFSSFSDFRHDQSNISQSGAAPNAEAGPSNQAGFPDRKSRPRFILKDEDMKVHVVKTCINHFDEYLNFKRKDDFMEKMQETFKATTGLEINFKGYLYRWIKERRKMVEEEKKKSGVARHYGEFEIALDTWITMIDGVARQTEAEKQARKQQELQKSQEIEKLRSSMQTTRAERHNSIPNDSESETQPSLLGQKHTTDSRYCPAESKKRITDRIMGMMKEESRYLVKAVEMMEEKKMDRLEEILSTVADSGKTEIGQAEGLEKRVEAIEEAVEELKGGMNRLMDYLEKNNK